MQTTIRHEAELEVDPLRHIQPVQFVMESRQTTIKFLRVADYSGGGVEHSLQLVSDRLRSSCIDSIAIVNTHLTHWSNFANFSFFFNSLPIYDSH